MVKLMFTSPVGVSAGNSKYKRLFSGISTVFSIVVMIYTPFGR
jgi:hypothetical protein